MMHQYVIYDRPADFPDAVVVRRWLIGPGTVEPDDAWPVDDLRQARLIVGALYPDAYRLDRSPGDDPTIIEVWI